MIVVVTAAIGTTESPPAPRFMSPDVRYVCACDRQAAPSGWELWRLGGNSSRMVARYAKMTASARFHDAEAVLWQDASFELLQDPRQVVAEARELAEVVGFVHPDRSRIRDEGAEVARLGLADGAAVLRQLVAYGELGFDTEADPQTKITTAGFLVMFPGPAVGVFCRLWFQQLMEYTVRDQLSIDFAAWRAGITIGHFPGHYRENAFARYRSFKHRLHRVAAA